MHEPKILNSTITYNKYLIWKIWIKDRSVRIPINWSLDLNFRAHYETDNSFSILICSLFSGSINDKIKTNLTKIVTERHVWSFPPDQKKTNWASPSLRFAYCGLCVLLWRYACHAEIIGCCFSAHRIDKINCLKFGDDIGPVQ